MSRPALSAFRALEIIDLMAGQPGEQFTLSDIVRLTGTNASSCHAILNVLIQRGYLLRDPERKTYRLAPAVVAIGEAAAGHDNLLAEARRISAEISDRTGHEVLLTAKAGGDIIAVARYAGKSVVPVGMRVGQRVPLRAPLGGLFFAWLPDAEADIWCAPDGDATPQSTRQAHEHALELLRERGFLVSLRTGEQVAFTRHLAEGVERRLTMLLAAMANGLYQPEALDAATDYRVQVLSFPIFDQHGRVLYNIGVSFPDKPVSGRMILEEAQSIIAACNEVWANETGTAAMRNYPV